MDKTTNVFTVVLGAGTDRNWNYMCGIINLSQDISAPTSEVMILQLFLSFYFMHNKITLVKTTDHDLAPKLWGEFKSPCKVINKINSWKKQYLICMFVYNLENYYLHRWENTTFHHRDQLEIFIFMKSLTRWWKLLSSIQDIILFILHIPI